MASRKTKLSRNTKSLHDSSSSRMKQLLHDFTDIKRPGNKQKNIPEVNTEEKSRTLPKNFKNTNTKVSKNLVEELQVFRKNSLKHSYIETKGDEFLSTANVKTVDQECEENFLKFSRMFSKSTSIKETKLDNQSKNKEEFSTVSLAEEIKERFKKTSEIQKKVEPFGDTLKRKRRLRSHNKSTLLESNNVSTDTNAPQSNFYNNLPSHDEDNLLESNNVSTDTSSLQSDFCNNLIKSEDENAEDMFGFNSFEDDAEDNYVVEAYNRLDEELVIVTLEITRRTVQQNNFDDGTKNLIDNSDYVFHKQEVVNDSGHTSESELYESCPVDVGEKSGYSSEQSTYYNSKHTLQNLQSSLDNEVLYDEICEEEPEALYMNTYEVGNEMQSKSAIKLQENENEKESNQYYDDMSNYSIIGEEINVPDETDHSQSALLNQNLDKKEKIYYIIDEMIKTEKIYISGLKMVIENYMPFIEKNTPQDLIGRTCYLFGNIKEIYNQAQTFFNLMERNSSTPDSLAQIFIDSMSYFNLYPQYSKNKPTADIYIKYFDPIIKERQRQLNDKLGLASYLLTPIQRPGKYVLLFEGIQKELKKNDQYSNIVAGAVAVVRGIMRKGNDYIAIDSIKDSEVELTNKGSFIIRGFFNILKPRKFVSMVFLFEHIVVFTERTSKHLEQFRYIDSIAMSDLSLGKFEEKPNIFHLTNYSKSKRSHPEATYILEAETSKIKNEWTHTIENILWKQLVKARDRQKKLSASEHTLTVNKPTEKHPTTTVNQNTSKQKKYRKAKSKFYDNHYL